MNIPKPPPLSDLATGMAFLSKLPFFLHNPINPDRAKTVLNLRFKNRANNFLNMMKYDIFGHHDNIYRKLLERVDCQFEDIRVLVNKEGVEGALNELFRAGVYLTLDEFKGRAPVIRGSASFSIQSNGFQRGTSPSGFKIHTSGSSGRSVYVPVNFHYIKSRSVNVSIDLAARNGFNWKHGIWGIPSGSSLVHLLELCGAGIRPNGWFSHLNPSDPELHPRYQWGIRALQLGSLFSLAPLPRPSWASVEDPGAVLAWIRMVRKSGRIPHLFTYLSSGIRLCQTATDRGVSLKGTCFTVMGEPVTPARIAFIINCGVTVVPRYGATECGSIGYGCLNPQTADDVHLLHDRVALVQKESHGGSSKGSIYLTSLLSSSPFVLMNVSLGDTGTITRRSCDCGLEHYGWKTHLHSIRSDEKCTCEGMSFSYSDLTHIIETVLPKRFGGNPTQYQFIEGYDRKGLPSLRLLLHPSVGPVDIEEVKALFYKTLDSDGGIETVMKNLWRDARLLKVERDLPVSSLSGKIRPVYSTK